MNLIAKCSSRACLHLFLVTMLFSGMPSAYSQIAEQASICEYTVNRGFHGELLGRGTNAQAICENAWGNFIADNNINVNLYGGYPNVVATVQTSSCNAYWPAGQHNYFWIHTVCGSIPPEPLTCPRQDGGEVGNPAVPATGEKMAWETDIQTEGPQPIVLSRHYRTTRVGGGIPSMRGFGQVFSDTGQPNSVSTGSSGSGASSQNVARAGFDREGIPAVGHGWSINWQARISLGRRTGLVDFDPTYVAVTLGGGSYRAFERNADGSWRPKGTHKDRFWAQHPGGTFSLQSQYFYHPVDSDDIYVFGFSQTGPLSQQNQDTLANARLRPFAVGSLRELRKANGWIYTIEPEEELEEEGMPRSVSNAFGQRLDFEYEQGHLTSVNHYRGSTLISTVRYAQDSLHRLAEVTSPDSHIKQYHYEHSTHPQLLTGYSSDGQRKATYSYDSQLRVNETSLTGNVNRYRIGYGNIESGNPTYHSAWVTDPLDTNRTYWYQSKGARIGVIGASIVGNDPNSLPVQSRSTNEQGMLLRETDFRGHAKVWTREAERQLPVTISEGGVTRTYQWHPTFRLPTQIDETGGKRTVNSYDERGNLTEQTIAATSGPTTSQTWRWAYNTGNLLTSETDPRGTITTHAYNSEGQRTQSTNALGHLTTYGFDAAGRLNRITQPDGLVQTMAYTPRGWLSESKLTAGGSALTTRYTYAPSGQVTQLRLPNGHVIDYRYDAAERLIGWTDNRGQRADYTLDPMGNITQELVRNSNGHLALEIRRIISSLNRVQSETRGPSIVEHYTQDANGRLASIRDAANGTTTLTRDALARITAITDPANRTARLTFNAQDAVTSAVDFKSVTTTYTRDVLGNARSEATPDAGTAQSTFDALGLPTQVVDALGRATAITRDALGRPTSFTHSGTGLAILVTDLRYDLSGDACNAPGHASASVGRLCEMTDSSNGVPQVTTRYQWDAFGRLTRQTQSISSAIADHSQVRSVAYAYAASSTGTGAGVGELQSITYPSGSVLTHQHDATGRLTGLLWNGAPLLRNLTHNALGQPLGWTWALSATAGGTTPEGPTLAALRSYNTAGELTATEFSQYTPNGRGLITALSQGLYRADGSGSGSGAWALENVPHSVQYDATGRITSFTAEGSTSTFQRAQTFTFDANGSRTSDTISTAGTAPVSYSHAIGSGNNRQTTFAGINVTTNAAGDITSLAGRTMAYDSAGRLHQATHTPACTSGSNCLGPQTTISHHNGHGQRFLRTTPQGQSVYLYGTDQYTVLAETHQTSALTTSNTEHIYLPTASGPMPVIAIIDGQRFAVHSDHLNTPRRLTDASNRPRWQWAYSAFGDLAAQSLPAAGLSTISYALRYPGQVDDGNGLFYNFNRFYDARVGRYTQADPIGLEGGWNRFGYVEGNPLSFMDPKGLVKWKGEMYGVTAVNLGGGGVFWFDLKSECVNGKYAYIRVSASALGVGLGIKYTATASSISFDDHLSVLYPEGFAGSFMMASAGFGAGLVGGYSAIRLGNNTADFSSKPTPGIGIDASISGLIGRSTLMSKEIKDCGCGW